MLRRILAFSFALLLFALAFSLPIRRSTAPPRVTAIHTETPQRILSALLLPRTALAQATRDTLDTLGGAPRTVVAAPVVVDSARAPSNHSHAILISVLALIVIVCFAVWFLSRRDKGERYDSAGAYKEDQSPHGRSNPRSP